MESLKSNDVTGEGLVQARDVMTSKAITVDPDTAARDIARVMLDNGISAVPVVDQQGTPIGMVSEGDLIGRDEMERLSRRDWWLGLVTGNQPLDEAFQARVAAKDRSARDVMSAPLVTVTEQSSVSDIARLLAIHHIKRVPVIRDGHIVGIVSRADLLKVVATERHQAAASPKQGHGFLLSLFGTETRHPALQLDPAPTDATGEKPKEAGLSVENFRRLVEDFHSGEVRHKDETRRAAALRRKERTKELIDAHVFDDGWRDMLHHARTAAENGQVEYLILRFPSQLCIDGARAINVAEDGWPATLRGEAAEIYLRWERGLKHRGFSLSARVVDFPGGKPGEVGLFLVWGGGAGPI